MNLPNGPEFEYKYLKPSQILVDMTYQRDLDQNRVNKIVNEWKAIRFREPMISYRDGKFYVFDGQHSTASWRSKYGDKPLYCKVFRGLTWLDEAEAFVEQNNLRKTITTNDRLKALYNMSNPDVVGMVKDAEECGIIVDFKKGKIPYRCVATAALFKAYKTLNREQFKSMLTMIVDLWHGDTDSLSADIICGFYQFYKDYYGKFPNYEFKKSFGKVSAASIIRDGRDYGGSREVKYSAILLKIYNKGRSSKKLEAK